MNDLLERCRDRVLDASLPLSRLADIGERLHALERDFNSQLGAMVQHLTELAKLTGDPTADGGDDE